MAKHLILRYAVLVVGLFSKIRLSIMVLKLGCWVYFKKLGELSWYLNRGVGSVSKNLAISIIILKLGCLVYFRKIGEISYIMIPKLISIISPISFQLVKYKWCHQMLNKTCVMHGSLKSYSCKRNYKQKRICNLSNLSKELSKLCNRDEIILRRCQITENL